MSRMKVMKPNDDGWCDCGLVHDMEFEYVTGGKLNEKFRVRFRARRNNRSTAALRRGKTRKV